MDDLFGHGDDFGLACPPLEEYAFNFDDVTTCFALDTILDDPLLQGEEQDNQDSIANYIQEDGELDKMVAACFKADIRTQSYGKGKELNILKQVLQVEKQKKRTIMHDYGCQAMQPKDMTKLDHTKQFVVLHNKRKSDTDLRFKTKLPRTYESTSRPMQPKDMTRLDDYDLRFQASVQRLHELYEQDRETKQCKQIQVIAFQTPVTKQPRCQAKSTRNPSLRQKLMAMGTHKSKKKFTPFVY